MAGGMGPQIWPRQGRIPVAGAPAGNIQDPHIQEPDQQERPVGSGTALTNQSRLCFDLSSLQNS